MVKKPIKGTIQQNIMMYLGKNEGATIEDIAKYVDIQEVLISQLLNSMLKQRYVSKDGLKYFPNYLYPEK
jgi:DNA-binding IscR family transcriptional regulator